MRVEAHGERREKRAREEIIGETGRREGRWWEAREQEAKKKTSLSCVLCSTLTLISEKSEKRQKASDSKTREEPSSHSSVFHHLFFPDWDSLLSLCLLCSLPSFSPLFLTQIPLCVRQCVSSLQQRWGIWFIISSNLLQLQCCSPHFHPFNLKGGEHFTPSTDSWTRNPFDPLFTLNACCLCSSLLRVCETSFFSSFFIIYFFAPEYTAFPPPHHQDFLEQDFMKTMLQ